MKKNYKLGLAILVVISMVTFSLQSAFAKSNGQAEQVNEEYVSGQLIVKFKEGVVLDTNFLKGYDALSAKKISKIEKAESKAGKSFEKFGIDRMYVADFLDGVDIINMKEKLNKDSRVEYAELNYIYHTTDIPNDPNLYRLWGMNNTGQTGGTIDADIDAPEGWNIQTGNSEVVIAVIDTGIDYTHPDLAANMWVNEPELNGLPGVDDDGNGLIDDVNGYDFVNDDGDPMDDHYHGTHCAGTIGAVGNDGLGIVGVNWNVSIMPIKFLSASGSGTTLDAIASVQYATLMGADVMSNSWGGGSYSQALEDAISAANDMGIVFVAAAGNTGTNNDVAPHYPSSYDVPNVIAVAATDDDDNRASFSCYGATSVDLGAPGVSIYSTMPNNSYGTLSGTSMATPHVAGAVGLIKAEYPLLTSDEIKTKLLGGVDGIPSMEGVTVTGGRLNIFKSLGGVTPPEENVAPVANAGSDQTVSDVDDDGVEAVVLDGTGSYDPDGTIVSYTWLDSGLNLIGSGALLEQSFSIGTHVVTLVVEDDEGATATDTLIVEITDFTLEETMHISNIDMSAASIKLRGWFIYATSITTVVDSYGNPVSGAEVFGEWSGLAPGVVSGVTNEYGRVVFDSGNVRSTNGTFTFTVTDVVQDALVYDVSSNIETSDSISVVK